MEGEAGCSSGASAAELGAGLSSLSAHWLPPSVQLTSPSGTSCSSVRLSHCTHLSTQDYYSCQTVEKLVHVNCKYK